VETNKEEIRSKFLVSIGWEAPIPGNSLTTVRANSLTLAVKDRLQMVESMNKTKDHKVTEYKILVRNLGHPDLNAKEEFKQVVAKPIVKDETKGEMVGHSHRQGKHWVRPVDMPLMTGG
jgi:hypothetical protein